MRLATLLFIASLFSPLAQAEVWQIGLEGAIGPASADHVIRSLEQANDNQVEAVVLRIDTPGGLDNAMRDIIAAILASPVPVIGYVAPQGSRAASAGTYILYATHVAAMAPATSLGAATPVQMGGMPSLPEPASAPDPEADPEVPQKDTAPQAPDSQQAMRNKVVNDAVAYIRGLAELRGRNSEWAAKAVTEGATLTAREALEQNVINLVADNTDALLSEAHGRSVNTAAGTVSINTAGQPVTSIEPDWRARFLGVITNPSVAYIMLMVGIYGLVLEFSNPGMGVGGIVGGICLLTALYALQMLPISYAALGLLLLGLGLMAAEAFAPSFGVLGLGGIAAFLIGSIMLMDTDIPGFQIALPVILGVTVASAGSLIVTLGLLLKVRHRPAVTGLSTLVGQPATVVSIHKGTPMVRLQGELWQVTCETPLTVGDRVQVSDADGLILHVTREP